MLRPSRKVCWVGAAFGLTLAVTTPRIYAQCEASETDQTSASDGVVGIGFGASTDISGNRMVVGAPDGAGLPGSAYVYDFDGSSWNEQPKLLATDTQADDRYGYSVAVDGNVAVVGAPHHTHAQFWQGAAYVFRFDGKSWTQELELLASDAGVGHFFGWSVAIDGDAIVVGAFNANAMGAAYVFRYNESTWYEENVLTASDAATDDRFGQSVDINADTVLVGAPRNDDNAVNSGSVYIYSWQSGIGWGNEVKVNASDAVAGDMLGTSVRVSADVAIMAANNDETGWDTGAAYLFRKVGATWIQEQKLSAPAGMPDASEFAFAVAVDGDVATVTAVRDDGAMSTTGTAYVYAFDGSSWTEQARLTAANGVRGTLERTFRYTCDDLSGFPVAFALLRGPY